MQAGQAPTGQWGTGQHRATAAWEGLVCQGSPLPRSSLPMPQCEVGPETGGGVPGVSADSPGALPAPRVLPQP